MKFLYPEFLWALLLLVIPIALHLFHLRRFKVFYFSNVSFLKQLDTASRSTRKLKELILLLVRLLVITFLILAFSQPYRPNSTTQNEAQGITAFIIDNSYSMSAMGTEGELLSQAKNLARQHIEQAKLGQQYLLITSLRNAEEARLKNKLEALDYIDQIGFSGQSVHIDDYFKFFSRVVGELASSPTLIILSDGQENQWIPAESVDIESKVVFVQFQPANNHNVAVDSVWTDRPLLKPGSPFELSLRVRNYGENKLNALPVSVWLDDNSQRFSAAFNEEGYAVIKSSYLTPEVGSHSLKVTVQDEQLFFDDELFSTFAIGQNLKVGIINEAGAGEQIDVIYGLDSYFSAKSWLSSQVPINELGELNLVVLNQLKDPSPALEQQLIKHIDAGKSVVFIPSHEANLTTWNRILENQQLPTLSKTDTSSVFIAEIRFEHKFFQGMFETDNPKIRIPVRRSHKMEMRTSRALPLMSYSDNTHFLVKSSNLGKQVYLFNSDFSKTNSALLNSDIVSALFLRIGELSGSSQSLYHTLGQAGQYTYYTKERNELPVTLTTTQGQFIPRQATSGNTVTLFLDEQDNSMIQAGIWDVSHGSEKIGKLAINYPRTESLLRFSDAAQLKEPFNAVGVLNFETVLSDAGSGMAQLAGAESKTYWRILLILALLCLFAEMLIVRWWKI